MQVHTSDKNHTLQRDRPPKLHRPGDMFNNKPPKSRPRNRTQHEKNMESCQRPPALMKVKDIQNEARAQDGRYGAKEAAEEPGNHESVVLVRRGHASGPDTAYERAE